MTERVWRIGGMMSIRKGQITESKICSIATLSISNLTSWPGNEPRNEGLYNYCVFQINNADMLSII